MSFLIGVLMTTVIFSVGTQALGTYGLFASLIVCIILSYLGLRKTTGKKILRTVTWGIIATTIFSILAYIFFLFSVAQVAIG